MLDLFNFPASQNCDIQTFTNPATVTNLQWLTWKKPRGTSMAYMMCIGGGGGGGGGFTAAASSARGGGGGGGSSGGVFLTIPLFLLPDQLFIQVGSGGAGVGSGGGTAGSGLISYISVYPDNSTVDNAIVTSGTAATGGGTGTGAAVGAAGNAGGSGSLSTPWGAGLCVGSLMSGQAGVAGGAVAGANGTNITISGSTITQGGSGGGGTTNADFAGGGVTAVSTCLLSQFAPVAAAAGANSGSGGPTLWKPVFFYGGLGGASSNASVGGQGGNGSYGSGGGGGGGGTTGGTGGRGGNGIVIIVSW